MDTGPGHPHRDAGIPEAAPLSEDARQELELLSLFNASFGDMGLIPGLGRTPGEGKGYPLQYCALKNSMDCIVHQAAMSQTQLSRFHFHFLL